MTGLMIAPNISSSTAFLRATDTTGLLRNLRNSRELRTTAPIVSTSDYVSSVAVRLCPWAPAGMCVLGTDGFGRSDTRAALRRHFQTDAEHITLAALTELARVGRFDRRALADAVATLGVDCEAPDSATA